MPKPSYHGTLWVIEKDMIANSDKRNDINGRKVLIEKGEIIEFRFHGPMNFRTMDDVFYSVSEETWLKHCVKIGIILKEVQSGNRAKTEEIWRLRLFDWVENGEKIHRRIKKEVEKPNE